MNIVSSIMTLYAYQAGEKVVLALDCFVTRSPKGHTFPLPMHSAPTRLPLPILGMGEGPKRALKSVNYRLEFRPLTDPRP